MATRKDLERTASLIIQTWKQSQTTVFGKERSIRVVQEIEKLAQVKRTANRDRALRVSVDGMFISKNAGSYISKLEAEQAIGTIKRLASKKRSKDFEPAT